MRIVIDLQAAQTSSSRHRGIGRYSMALVKAMAQNPRGHQLLVALNGRFKDSIDSIRAELDGLVPQQDIKLWHPSGDETTPVRHAADVLIREAFMASLEPDIVHVTSIFEGLNDASGSTIGSFTSRLTTAVTLYDLIPYIYRKIYLADPNVERWYLSRISHLRRADLLLGISESARREAVEYLGIPAERTVNISSDVDDQFQVIAVDPGEELELRQRYALDRPFVMYTGGIDHRKNIEGLIRAFARLPVEVRRQHQLAVVCSASQESRQGLLRLAREQGLDDGDLVMTGFVPERDLVVLYNVCRLFVFPSWHEGFGLPALEAMRCGAPVVASNTSSLPEVVGRSDALFDPHSDASMTSKLLQVLTDDVFRAELARHGSEQARKFSWHESARRTLQAFEATVAAKAAEPVRLAVQSRRPRLAFLSPLPPERSGIADYSAQLLPDLSRYYDIDVVTPQASVSDQAVLGCCTLRSVEWFREHAGSYDRVLYQMGNSQYHEHMFQLLEEVPGVVVLHDFFLSGIQAFRTVFAGAKDAWIEELYRSHGYAAVMEDFRAADASVAVYRYPCNHRVLQRAIGTIVHSDYSSQLAEQWYGEGMARDWKLIPLVRAQEPWPDRSTARQALGIGEDDFVVCSYGHLGSTKQNHRLLQAWLASTLADDQRCQLIFVGENPGCDYGAALQRTIDQSAAAARVRISGWSDPETFRRYLAVADVAVQLRTLSRGETSAAVLDCMGHGVATIVNANGSMATLPADAVVMLPDEFSDGELQQALERLFADAGQRADLGARARDMIETLHAPARCAEEYAEAIESFYAADQDATHSLVAGAASSLLAAGGSEADMVAVAEAVALSLPARQPARQLLVDVSGCIDHSPDGAVATMLVPLLCNPPPSFRTEPVYASADGCGYRYARGFSMRLLGLASDSLRDEIVEVQQQDRYRALVPQDAMTSTQLEFVQSLRRAGVPVAFADVAAGSAGECARGDQGLDGGTDAAGDAVPSMPILQAATNPFARKRGS